MSAPSRSQFGTKANGPSAEFHILEALLMHGSDGVIEVPVVGIIASVCLQELAGATRMAFGREPLYSLLRNARVDHAVLGYFALQTAFFRSIDFFNRQCVALWTQTKPSNARALSDVLPRTGHYFASSAMRGTVRPRSKLPGARLKKRIYGFTFSVLTESRSSRS